MTSGVYPPQKSALFISERETKRDIWYSPEITCRNRVIFHDFLWELSATRKRENDKTINEAINVTFDAAEILARGKLGLSLTTCVLRCTFRKTR